MTAVRKMYIANKDIPVYKAVLVDNASGDWKSLYGYNEKMFGFGSVLKNDENMDVRERFNRLYLSGFYEVYGGFFHSFKSKEDAFRLMVDMKDAPNMPHGTGCSVEVVECAIPKGSGFYKSCGYSTMRFASREIIVRRKLK